jgi:hypothetical protein
MKRSGQKSLSILLLLPILTILAHNSVAHHHHASPFEICCGIEAGQCGNDHQLSHFPYGHDNKHDACSFNPEFTLDLFKILIAAAGSAQDVVICPLKFLESTNYPLLCRDIPGTIGPAPYLLRGPPSKA